MAGADYLAMVSDPELLLSVARSIDGSKISQLLGEYQQMTQTMTETGQFGHDVDNAASSQLFGKFVDEAHHESAVLSYAALNIADTCNRMKAKLSNFYEQYVEKVRPAAQALQQAYDAQLGQGGVGSPAELRTASTALAKALSHLYTDLAGNPTINVVPTFPEAAIPDIGAAGRRTAAASAPRPAPPGDDRATGSVARPDASEQALPNEQAATGQVASGQAGAGQAGPEQALSNEQAAPGRTSPEQAGPGQAGQGQSGGAGGAVGGGVVGSGGSGQAPRGGKQGIAGTSGQAGSGQAGSLASALGGALGALGQAGSAAGAGLAGAVGAGAGAASTGVGIAGDAVGLGASLGGLAAQPASAEGALDGPAESGEGEGAEAEIGDGIGSGEPAATKPAADLSSGGGAGGSSPHALPEARVSPAPELRPAPAGAGSVVEVSASAPAAASNGMMGMPMMGGAGMNGAGGEHRVANYLISKEQGERQFTAGLPLASEEILGALDERERLAMQIASIDDPGGEPD